MVRLETERLVVRHGATADAGAIARYLRENREHLARWEPIRPELYFTERFWRARLPDDVRDYQLDRALRLFLFPKDAGGEVAGVANFTNLMRGPFQACYLGYALGRRYEGQGYMTEALTAALEYVFDQVGLHRVMANHLPENERSGAVLRRLGFQVEGLAPAYLLIDGRWRDHVLTAKVNPRWRPSPEVALLVRGESGPTPALP